MKNILLAMTTALPLAACAASGPAADVPATPVAPEMACNADPVQSLVGQKAIDAIGAQILQATGARNLRWGPPNSAWTMDYRTDRVNVSYDDQMVITRISCG